MTSLDTLKMGTKLLIMTLLTVAIGAGISIYEATKLRSIDDTYSAVLDNDVTGTIKLAEITGNSDSIGRDIYRLIAESDQESMSNTRSRKF